MNAYVLDRRHSKRGGCCDFHNGYVSNNQAVSRLLIKEHNGQVIAEVSICRPCAHALARNARLQGES